MNLLRNAMYTLDAHRTLPNVSIYLCIISFPPSISVSFPRDRDSVPFHLPPHVKTMNVQTLLALFSSRYKYIYLYFAVHEVDHCCFLSSCTLWKLVISSSVCVALHDLLFSRRSISFSRTNMYENGLEHSFISF